MLATFVHDALAQLLRTEPEAADQEPSTYGYAAALQMPPRARTQSIVPSM